MTELFQKSIRTLELPQVLELLAAQAVSEDGKAQCLALCPSTNEVEVTRLLGETTAARDMMDRHGAPALSRLKPVEAILQRANLGGSLNNRELLDIAAVLRCARQVAAYDGLGERETVLDGTFRALRVNHYLEEKITGSILSEEEIADNASPELADIRRHIRLSTGKAREVLQRLISSSAVKYLQEPIITIRSDRFVVPVKAECKGSVPGLVHDVSATGSTYFIEPMAAVEANNELRELLNQEELEVARILAALSAEASSYANDILLDYQLLVELDVIFARAKLSTRMLAVEPTLRHDGGFVFHQARHPLLDRKKAVPIDLRLGTDFDTLVITGPNTGGKTVTLKTAGLLTLMAQCGLHLPVADGSSFSVFDEVLADIGDEQSIEQSLSTFSSHITTVVKILEEAGDNTLILYDELGAGTDPIEGAALAVAIIEESRSLGARLIATTHYAELKLYAMTTPGVQNASCEFDIVTLRPTYRLLIGVPGKSNAFAISRRLGLPEHVISHAAERIDQGSVQFEDVLSQLEMQRQRMESERREAAKLRRQLEQDAAVSAEHRRKIEEERAKVVDTAKAEARQIIADARTMSNTVFNELDSLRKRQKQSQDWQAVNEERSDLRRRLNQAEEQIGQQSAAQELPPSREAVVGDQVELVKTRTRAEVLSVGKDGTLQLQAGILKITAKQADVRVLEMQKGQNKKPVKRVQGQVHSAVRSAGARQEIDLRGMMVDEAIPLLEQYLDNAVMAHLKTVTIIHGKGTGALRAGVQQYLKSCKYVKGYRLGRYGEGETGVTVVELK
jgi:DNA mismatch repair protein MutS2